MPSKRTGKAKTKRSKPSPTTVSHSTPTHEKEHNQAETSIAISNNSRTPQLPNEIIHQIISNFTTYNQGTLASCCLVSKAFSSVAHPLLWKWVRLSPPPSTANIKDGMKKDVTPINISSWTEEDRQGVHFLSVSSHQKEWCDFKHPRHLDLPNIKVLQIVMGDQYESFFFHKIPLTSYTNTSCPLTKNLLPLTMIIRNAAISINHHHLRYMSPRSWAKVQELVFVFSYTIKRSYWYERDKNFKFPNLSTVFWIFDPIAQGSSSTLDNFDSIDPYNRMEDHLLEYLLVQFPNTPITIVNVGPPNLYTSRRSTTNSKFTNLSSEAIFRRKHAARHPSWSPSRALEKQKLITFVTLEEFLKEENWRAWFEETEVEVWRKTVENSKQEKDVVKCE